MLRVKGKRGDPARVSTTCTEAVSVSSMSFQTLRNLPKIQSDFLAFQMYVCVSVTPLNESHHIAEKQTQIKIVWCWGNTSENPCPEDVTPHTIYTTHGSNTMHMTMKPLETVRASFLLHSTSIQGTGVKFRKKPYIVEWKKNEDKVM